MRLLVFGLDLPLLGFTNKQQKMVMIEEKQHYPIANLFNIGENMKVKQFLLQVCYTAMEEIGFENFIYQFERSNPKYLIFLANLCIDLTKYNDSEELERHQVSIKLKDLESKAYYEECSIEYKDDTNRYVLLNKSYKD